MGTAEPSTPDAAAGFLPTVVRPLQYSTLFGETLTTVYRPHPKSAVGNAVSLCRSYPGCVTML